MLSLIYLLVCAFTGYAIAIWVMPEIFSGTSTSFGKKKIDVSPILLWIPAVIMTGILLVTWSVYLLANLFYTQEKPLFYANTIAMLFYIAFSVVLVILKKKKGSYIKPVLFTEKKSARCGEIVFLLLTFLFALLVMWYTFYVKDGNLYVGRVIFGDFSTHLSMARSFSWGNNFPTWYSFYAGNDVKYHFMFQFLVGNLEFLGMRIDFAFNVPSIMWMLFVYMLLYVLTVKITGKRLAGYFALLFYSFRSSESFFTYLAETPKEESLMKKLSENRAYIGYTKNENWGIWNINAYANQRHLVLCFAILLLVLILVLPKLYATFEMWNEMKLQEGIGRKEFFTKTFFAKEGWLPQNITMAVFIGFFVGASAFWNGAVFISLVILLFFIAVLGRNRLEFVIIAGIAGVLSLIQSNVFMEESSITAAYHFGYIVDDPTVWSVAQFIIKLMGVFLILLAASFLYYRGINRYLLFVFATPLIFGFTVTLTTDANVNHKYILLSWMLLDTVAAGFLADMVKKKDAIRNVGVALIIVMMTSTGIYDAYCFYHMNGPKASVALNLKEPVTQWIKEECDSTEIFLTPPYTLNKITAAGAMLFNGYQYFSWSAGYDTGTRDAEVIEMYSASTSEQLIELVEEHSISYIVVDADSRAHEEYNLREDVIAATFEVVYTEGSGNDKLTIYDTRMRLLEE